MLKWEHICSKYWKISSGSEYKVLVSTGIIEGWRKVDCIKVTKTGKLTVPGKKKKKREIDLCRGTH